MSGTALLEEATMDHRITVGLDGSPESAAAARWAAREAELRHARLRIVHAGERPVPVGVPEAASAVRGEWAEVLLRESAAALRRVHPELDITTGSVCGPPAAALATEAATSDLLVLGSRGLGTLTGFAVGSVAHDVLHATERPVVLVRSGEDALPHPSGGHSGRDLVVGVDISRPCDPVLAFAFEEASRRSCLLHVVHAWTPTPLFGSGAAYDPRIRAQLGETMAGDLDDALAPWRDRFPSVQVTARAPMGHAAQKLLAAGAEAGLIVVGRRIRRPSYGARVGSTTHAVIHHSTSPVAVVAHD
ncbi:universal stress protein [Streptomyces sp. NPDC001389]|uniref:universal stress protein n=1 Tax=unclassified Streptomyces TaxID=2593676 RepID=UPI00369EB583